MVIRSQSREPEPVAGTGQDWTSSTTLLPTIALFADCPIQNPLTSGQTIVSTCHSPTISSYRYIRKGQICIVSSSSCFSLFCWFLRYCVSINHYKKIYLVLVNNIQTIRIVRKRKKHEIYMIILDHKHVKILRLNFKRLIQIQLSSNFVKFINRWTRGGSRFNQKGLLRLPDIEP